VRSSPNLPINWILKLCWQPTMQSSCLLPTGRNKCLFVYKLVKFRFYILEITKLIRNIFPHVNIFNFFFINIYTGCRKINVFQGEGLVGKNLRNLEKIKIKNIGGSLQRYMGLKVQTFHHVFLK
jgi:hypothetical protein